MNETVVPAPHVLHEPEVMQVAPQLPPRGRGPLHVLLVAAVGALLVGFAGFAASEVLPSDQPLPQTICADANCTYAMSADGSRLLQPAAAQHKPRSAVERFARGVLYFCHIR